MTFVWTDTFDYKEVRIGQAVAGLQKDWKRPNQLIITHDDLIYLKDSTYIQEHRLWNWFYSTIPALQKNSDVYILCDGYRFHYKFNH